MTIDSSHREPTSRATPLDWSGYARRAFTLIELLIVIAIVGLLVAITLPAVSKSRAAARRAVCLANLRSLVTCWITYTDDYRAFPCGELPQYQMSGLRMGWGGVHWYGQADSPASMAVPAERPLNPYVLTDARIETRAAMFKCPSDTGGYLAATGLRTWDEPGATSLSGEGLESCYGVSGNSYQANTWMYCVPVAPQGWGFSPLGVLPPRFRSNQNFAHVLAEPSRFIVLGEFVAMAGGRYSRAEQLSRNLFTGAWHKAEHGQLGFLDGSARLEKMGAVNTQRYTFYLAPAKYPPGSYRTPSQQ